MPTFDKASHVNTGKEAGQILILNERFDGRVEVGCVEEFYDVEDVPFGEVVGTGLR